jgi:hypothetical protein
VGCAAVQLHAGERCGGAFRAELVRIDGPANRGVDDRHVGIGAYFGSSFLQAEKQGNYCMGVSEQIIFPEINYDQIDAIRGMDITISTTARNAEEGRALLEAFSFPFKK